MPGHLLADWRHIERLGRLLRVLCKHPGFQFESDGIDADMVRVDARALVSRLEAMGIELPRMLTQPGEHDQVPLDDVAMRATTNLRSADHD